jgi:hypothetical protein
MDQGSNNSSGKSRPSGSVGSGIYVVKQGDCIESIAFNSGHFWKTLWDHPDNQQLRAVRKNPNVLLAGDKVLVPDIRIKQETGATQQRYRFRRKGVPAKLVMIFKDENDQPRADVPYVLEIDGTMSSGQTDAQGAIKVSIPPNASRGKLVLVTGDGEEQYELNLGHIDPVEEISGAKQRLSALGFAVGEADCVWGPASRAAISDFQAKHSLNVTGEPDQATREKLVQQYGS